MAGGPSEAKTEVVMSSLLYNLVSFGLQSWRLDISKMTSFPIKDTLGMQPLEFSEWDSTPAMWVSTLQQ